MTTAADDLHLFEKNGWLSFDHDSHLQTWIDHALPAAKRAMGTSEHVNWWRYSDTWFVGVNALPNNQAGQLPGGPPLCGQAISFISRHLPFKDFDWDKAQVSVCMPGYPQPGPQEPESAHRYRVNRDAAHIDGLRRVEPERRRFLDEYHGFILGIPMQEFGKGASPFVVWEGSHLIAAKAFNDFYRDIPSDKWSSVDATDLYHSIRRQMFEQCKRVEISLRPGQCFVVHRFALHGMAAWREPQGVSVEGRMISYFRPEIDDPVAWLTAP